MLCSSSVGKHMHAVVRKRVFSFSDSWMAGSPCGGRPGVNVDFASHAVKAFLDIPFAKKLASMLMFTDMHRPLLFHSGGSKDALA